MAHGRSWPCAITAKHDPEKGVCDGYPFWVAIAERGIMKVYRVVIERDGETTKKPGETSTEIIRTEIRFAADEMEQVWVAMEKRLELGVETIIAIIEEHPAIIILEG